MCVHIKLVLSPFNNHIPFSWTCTVDTEQVEASCSRGSGSGMSNWLSLWHCRCPSNKECDLGGFQLCRPMQRCILWPPMSHLAASKFASSKSALVCPRKLRTRLSIPKCGSSFPADLWLLS